MKKDIYKILLFTAFFSISIGIFYNFQELFLSSNNISVSTIGKIYSLGSFACVPAIFIFANFIKQKNLKKAVCILLATSILSTISLYFLNNSGYVNAIRLLTAITYILHIEILVCIYPLLCIIKKDDKLFSKKEITFTAFNYLGMYIATIFLHMVIFNKQVNYNTYVLWSIVISILALLVLYSTKLDKYFKKGTKSHSLIVSTMKKASKDKISIIYLLYAFLNVLSSKLLYGLSITVLTASFFLEERFASLLRIFSGAGASLLAALFLSFLTFKNNYLNIAIKFVSRIILLILALTTDNYLICLIAYLFPLISGQIYSSITDAPYVNRYSGDEQLSFSYFKDMVRYSGEAIGVYLCGILFITGIKMNLLIALILCFIQLILAYIGLYFRNMEANNDRK